MPQRRSHFVVPPDSPPPPPSSAKASAKRAHSPPPSTKTPPSRQSKRLKSSPIAKTTPKKSPYFEHKNSVSEEPESNDDDDDASGYDDGDDDASAVSSPASSETEPDDESEEYDDSEEEGKGKGKGKKRGRKPAPAAAKSKGATAASSTVDGKKGQELWRPGVKSHLAPGEAIYIKVPRARSPGKTPYTPQTIHPNTLLFLGDLHGNNDREWLKMHDADYRASQSDWNSYVESLTEKVIEKDETIPELPPKDLTFRIYRDVRFSPDPTPYKTHFSAAWSRTGRKGPYAGYYLQIKPKGSFVGAGIWHPDAPPTALLRDAIDRKSDRLKAVLMAPALRKAFFNNCAADEKICVKRFVEMNMENALKTKPKGYSSDHPNIALLRLRNFTIGKKLKDEEILGPQGLDRIAGLVGVLEPFVTYLNSVVMPDQPDEEEDDEEDDEEEEDADEDDKDDDEEE